jgi:Tfp pilus assembly protein PilV
MHKSDNMDSAIIQKKPISAMLAKRRHFIILSVLSVISFHTLCFISAPCHFGLSGDHYIYSRSQSGFSMLEALISMALLSALLLGFDAMELSLLRASRSAYLTAVAVDQLQNMAEQFSLLSDSGDIQRHLAAWNQDNQSVLPEGSGVWTGSTLTVYWRDATTGVMKWVSQTIALTG